MGNNAGHDHGFAGAASFDGEGLRRGTWHRRDNVERQAAEKLLLTPENNDLFHQFALKGADLSGSNDVAIHFAGEGGLAYQVTGQYFVPLDGETVR